MSHVQVTYPQTLFAQFLDIFGGRLNQFKLYFAHGNEQESIFVS